MRFSSLFTALLGSAACASAAAIPSKSPTTRNSVTKIRPGSVKDMIVSEETTLNGTHQGDTRILSASDVHAAVNSLPLHFVNNFGGDINAYVTGKVPGGAVVFVRADGSLLYPSSGGSEVPVDIGQDMKIPLAAGEALDMDLPTALESGRVYFAAGELQFGVVLGAEGESIVQPAPNNPSDPSADLNWGIVELTYNEDGSLWANISYVDFVGMPLGIELIGNGNDTQSAYGVSGDAVARICETLQAQTDSDGRPWASLCMGGDSGPVRALSPTAYTDIDSEGFKDYYDDYVNEVWSKYSSSPLVINTQTPAGSVNCQVQDDQLACDGDSRAYPKPTAWDIWGCNSGPFTVFGEDNDIHEAVVPRLCAAFVRSTLLLDGGDTQPSLGQESYYTADPTNHYSRAVHEHEVDGKGYGFAYDDVNPDGNENASGTLASETPGMLTVFVGNPPE
ncbi:hypothetical protein ACO1O0_004351 [Amphichorda felina]